MTYSSCQMEHLVKMPYETGNGFINIYAKQGLQEDAEAQKAYQKELAERSNLRTKRKV